MRHDIAAAQFDIQRTRSAPPQLVEQNKAKMAKQHARPPAGNGRPPAAPQGTPTKNPAQSGQPPFVGLNPGASSFAPQFPAPFQPGIPYAPYVRSNALNHVLYENSLL